MFKWIAVSIALLAPVIAQAQQPMTAAQEADLATKSVCLNDAQKAALMTKGKKAKAKTMGDKVVPLGQVICEVQNALDTYQQSNAVDSGDLFSIVSADLDFKTIVDTKGSLGVGFFIFKILGGSIDKQQTDEVDFQYVPKSRLKFALDGGKAKTFQEELVDVITNAAKAIKEQRSIPARPGDKDPLVFQQLTVTVSFGVRTYLEMNCLKHCLSKRTDSLTGQLSANQTFTILTKIRRSMRCANGSLAIS